MTLRSFRSLPSLSRTWGLKEASIVLQCILLASAVIHTPHASAQQSHLERDFGKVPLSFEANRGQVDPRVKFVSRGPGYALFLSGSEAVIEIQKPTATKREIAATAPEPISISTLRMQLRGSNAAAQVTGGDVLPGTANYLIGSDPKKWQTAVPTYKRVNYKAIYPGVDLVYYGNQRQLEYDFVVAPGADAGKIALAFTGTTPRLDRSSGDLVLALASGETRFHKPAVYQMAGDRRVPVDGRYLVAKNEVHFALGSYDHTKTLVIDPVLSYLTYLGGSGDDQLNGIAVDASGSAYVVGTTTSLNFPLANAYQSTDPGGTNGNQTMFVTKFNSTGTALVYSTYLGGTGNTIGFGIAVDNGGSAYAVGYVDTGGYPVTSGAFQTICGGNHDAQGNRTNGCTGAGQGDDGGVLTKLSPNGQSLVYSTYLSGNNFNAIIAVAVNAAGEAYVTGITNAHCGKPPYSNNSYLAFSCFPTTAGTAQDPTDIGGGGTHTTGFFTKFNAAGSGLIYSSILGIDQAGPQGATNPYGVAIDAAGDGYIAGFSTYTLFTTPGSYKPIYTGAGRQAYVAKFDPAAQALIYSTFVGGTTNFSSQAQGIAADSQGNAYIAGLTTDCGFPTTPGAYQTQAAYPPGTATNCTAGFVTKLNPAGSALVWSTFLGDRPNRTDGNGYLYGIALGSDNSVYVAGSVGGGTFPSANPVLPQGNYGTVAVVSHLDPTGSNLLFSSTIGSPTACTEPATSIALDPSNNIYVAGVANGCTVLPTTPGAFQATGSNPGNGQLDDGFVAKIAPFITSTTTVTLSSSSVTAGQPVTLTATVAGPAGSPVPTGTVTFLNGSTTLGTGTLDSTGKATYTTSVLSATTYMLSASYGGDSNYSASTSAAQTLVVNPISTTTALTINPSRVVAGTSVSLSAKVIPSSGGGIPTGTVTFTNGSTQLAAVALDSAGTATFTSSNLPVGSYSITAAYSGDTTYSSSTGSAPITVIVAGGTAGLQFIPVTPCRVADTRGGAGPFGGPVLSAGTTREFDIPQSSCGIPTSAVAYSLNVTVVPNGTLNYLTMWPTGLTQPYVSTLNSDGRVKANAAITPAGTNGGVNVFVSDATNVILDIDGYFVPAGTASALAFYPVTPCRVSDTRGTAGSLGGPFIAANTHRDFPVQSSSCGIPANAQAYSLNVTAVPHTTLNYLTAWSTGQTQPYVSTLNSSTGAVAANAAIVPAASNGDVSIFVSDDADVILDVNGYFAPPASGGLSLYTTTPCRIIDTRGANGAFNGVLSVAAQASACAPSAAARAYVLNATVVPSGSLNYLSLWPNGQNQPNVSTLNARDGAITSNMAIVPNTNGTIDVFSSDPTNVILDISSYFAP